MVVGITVLQAYSVDGRYTEILVAEYLINSIASSGDISKIDNIKCQRSLQIMIVIIIRIFMQRKSRAHLRTRV